MAPKFKDGDVVVSVSKLPILVVILKAHLHSSMANGSPGLTPLSPIQLSSLP